jgi:hypothetical protein
VSPTLSPTACASIASGPAPLCAPVNEAGEADVTDQGADIELEMVVPGLRFSPTYIRAQPAAKVTITLRSTQASMEFAAHHTFTIDSPTVNQAIGPGQTSTLTFVLPSGQPYVPFYCAVGGSAVSGHRAGGMQGAFYFS